MPLISTSFPNLTGGVSQQPSSQRLPNQCEKQENALPLIVGGLIKRPPTNHVAEIKKADGSALDLSDSFTHLVQRDSNERFFVSIKPNTGGIFVHDLDGTPRTVYSADANSSYIQSATPKTAFRAVTIADVTFLLNTEITASMKTDAADLSPYSRSEASATNEGLIWIKNTAQGVTFKAGVTPSGGTLSSVQVKHNPTPIAIDDVQLQPGLTVWYSGPADDGATPPVSNFATVEVTTSYVRILSNDTITASQAQTYYFNSESFDTIEEIATHINTRTNWNATVDGDVGASSSNLNPVQVTNCYSGFNDGSTQTYVPTNPVELKVAPGEDQFAYPPNPPGTSEIAESLATGTTPTNCVVTYEGASSSGGLNNITDITAQSSGSVIFISHASADFQLNVDDSFGQKAISIIKDEVQSFSDLPPIAKNGMIILVKGEPESEVDDYYVKFETNGGGDFGEGIWIETIGPGIVYQWNYDTLPHIIVRQPDNTFVVKKSDGLVPSANGHADLASTWPNFKFTSREAGSELTNPLPSFVDQKITDISFFKNRLTVLSGENCSLSEAAELFNFFRTTTTQLLDTAPIDVGVGGTEINKLEKASPFSDRLVLFSERAQFVLQGEAVLSPLTASITRATNFDITTSADPIPAGNTMFFAFNRGSFSGVREFYKTNETDINFDAIESTAQAPKYIEGVIKKMAVSTMEDLMVVQSSSETTLYVYKYFKTAQERVQSAWFKFTFNNSMIIDINFVQQSLYLLIKRGSKTYLERMDLQNGLTDVGATYTTNLDRRIEVTGDGTDSPSGGFTLNLENTARPDYEIESGDTIQVVSADGEVMTIASQTSNTITLKEQFSASDKFFVGVPYTMLYELTEPVLKRPKVGGGFEMVATGRHQVRYMTVVYDDTAYFKVKVTPEIAGSEGTAIEYPFSGRFLSTGGFLGSIPSSSGDFRFPVFAQSDSIKIEIENDSPFPSNIQSIEFEAQYSTRSQRMQ